MAIDEFGREVKGGRRGDRSPSPYPSSTRDGGAPSHLYQALPTSRTVGGGNSSGGDAGSGDRTGGGRKRRHRSESPPPGRDRSHKTNKSSHHSSHHSHSQQSKEPHPSTVYAEEPMLCQFLWKENNPDKTEDDYNDYRRSYCLNYVRTFFNEHMDDSWFRSMYSPLGKFRVALQERKRASQEASDFGKELETSLARNAITQGRCFFVLKARLGNGTKTTNTSSSSRVMEPLSSSPTKSPRILASSTSGSSSLSNPVPATHVFALASQVLPIHDVPPHVTDEQLTFALMSHCSNSASKAKNVEIFSSSVSTTSGDLNRTAYLYAPEDVRKDIIQQLNILDRGPSSSTNNNVSKKSDGAHVPRKEETYIPKLLELEVECSDAYGRVEVDADGKGGAPEDGGVPPRKATVWVSTQPLPSNVQVLSAAVSSRERIASDAEAAQKLAKAYDRRRQIPLECRLETMLPQAIPSLTSEPSPQDLEDALDVSIAYLRRVHLFSFYNGCTTATTVADVFHGNHATSTIHLRLGNADEILASSKEDTTATSAPADAPPKVDLLVQRLNASIQKALDESQTWLEGDGDENYVVNEEVDTQAKEIEYQESQVEHVWIEDHALVDEDGRARCSFHFCRKLFKDSSFLKKHLIKKHSEFLRAEMAKCHDSYMMKAWDMQEQRPVPPILVECGRAFSVVPSPVIGAAEPLAADPEPELWRRQEERRRAEEEEQEARRERYQQHQQQQQHHHQQQNQAPDLNGPLSEERAPRHNNFVDVDDMKEEKIDLAFDNIEVPLQPPKKKKRKKLL